jgi:small subunit ribosomal protein S21
MLALAQETVLNSFLLFCRKEAGASWMEIKVFNNNVEKALKIAKKKLAGEGLFRELKRRRFYEKPSLKKKNKEREAQRRRQKWLAKHKSE